MLLNELLPCTTWWSVITPRFVPRPQLSSRPSSHDRAASGSLERAPHRNACSIRGRRADEVSSLLGGDSARQRPDPGCNPQSDSSRRRTAGTGAPLPPVRELTECLRVQRDRAAPARRQAVALRRESIAEVIRGGIAASSRACRRGAPSLFPCVPGFVAE